MSRKLWLCVLMLGLACGVARASRVHAQEGGDAPQQDGPAPVDTEESMSAGAGDDFSGRQSQTQKGKLALKHTGDEHPAGTYAGVEPGGTQSPPIPTPAGTTPPTITWPGFQMRPNGTSRVFVQSTSSIVAATSSDVNTFSVRFPGAKIAGDTNRFPLETRFFNTPVTRVNIVVEKDAVVVRLELRTPVSPQVSSERGPSGYYFTYIDLPAGKFVDVPAAAQPSAAPAAGAPPAPEHATFLDGDLDIKAKAKAKAGAKASASIKVDTSMDNELPPDVKANKKTQPKAQASGGVKLGK